MMNIKPPLLCCCAVCTVLAVSPAFAGSGERSYSSSRRVESSTNVYSVEEREAARRQDNIERAREAIAAGDVAMKQRDYETAFAQYRLACDLLPDSPTTHRLRTRALDGLCDAACSLAEQRIAEGRYQDAENTAKFVLDERYDPHCHRAIVILAHLEDPDYYNKTITPKFRGNVEEVKRLLREAEGYYQTGQYDKSFRSCEKVLNIDPYNIAARKMEEKVNVARDNYAVQGYTETRSRAIWQVDNAWQNPVRRFGAAAQANVYGQVHTDVTGTQRITEKLNRIIIPKIEFRDATVREAIDFLKQKSRELDTTETDPTKRGVNIVLQLETPAAPPAPAPGLTPEAGLPGAAAPATPGAPGEAGAAPGAAPAIPGLEATPATPGAAPAAPAINPADARITLSLTNIPLMEALRYITSLSGLKIKIDPYAVAIVPLTANVETLITKEYKVPPGFISSGVSASTSGSLGAGATKAGGGGEPDATKGGVSPITQRVLAKDFLVAAGVDFPPGATATYSPLSSRLLVKNTQANLDLVDALVEAAIQTVPKQVEIESKFVEITQNNTKELSFSTVVGPFNVPGTDPGGGAPTGRVNLFGGTGTVNATEFPTATTGLAPLTSGLRSGNAAISANAIDALLFPSGLTQGATPGILGIQGALTDPQFQIVMRAINQKKGVDLLSAPRVTTKSGQRAVIEIIREFRYPTEFNPPQIPQNFGGNSGGGGVGGGTSQLNVFPVTPTTPTAFETRNTGVTLEVEPTVGPDGLTIDLNLVPQVVEFEGFINYGSPIRTINPATLGLGGAAAALAGTQTSIVLTDNVINQPIFSTRKVTTSVSVYDGQTVVLGGLMREDVQKVEDKVPLFGDIPLVGRLFRSSVDQHLKRNLVIFVTARLINPAGQAINEVEEAEEVVEPLPLPSVPTAPLPETPLFQK